MMLLYGRPRLGKSYLLQRYFSSGQSGDDRPHCYFLAQKTTARAQRAALVEALWHVFPSYMVSKAELAGSWSTIFRYLSDVGRRERFALILDDFQFLLDQSPDFPSMLKGWWDREGVHSSVMVVLCGSRMPSMEGLAEHGAPLFGRFNAGLFRMQTLSYEDVASFYGGRYSLADTLLMYGVFGGTARYHALVDPSNPAREEIVRLLLQPRAVLEEEARFVLDEETGDTAPYHAILSAVARGETQSARIREQTGLDSGTLALHMETLQRMGWLYRERLFGEKSDRRMMCWMADPFPAFWYRFVAPHASALRFGDCHEMFASRVAPYLHDHMQRRVLREICVEWLRRHGRDRLGWRVQSYGRSLTKDTHLPVDLIGDIGAGRIMVAAWTWEGAASLGDFDHLRRMATLLKRKEQPSYVMFAVDGFAPELHDLASDAGERLFLVSGQDLLPDARADRGG
jgi:hypothetical protein